jgi:hypothetical protein
MKKVKISNLNAGDLFLYEGVMCVVTAYSQLASPECYVIGTGDIFSTSPNLKDLEVEKIPPLVFYMGRKVKLKNPKGVSNEGIIIGIDILGHPKFHIMDTKMLNKWYDSEDVIVLDIG